MNKVLKWSVIILLGLVMLILLILHLATPFINGGEGHAQRHFEEYGYNYEENFNQWNGRKLHWVETGNPEASTMIFFSHGAPGSWKDFSRYLVDSTLQKKVFMVSMDRPGYGMSDYGKAETSIIDQAATARHVIKKYQFDSLFLVGYSYGGPIAGVLASQIDIPVKHLIMLAPVIHPDHEKLFWFNHLFKSPLIRWMLPQYIRVANREKLRHANALREIQSYWDDIEAPVTHMHCKDDWIAPYEPNVNFSRKHIPDTLLQVITWTGDNHFLPNHVTQRVLPVMYEMLGH